MLYKIIDNEHFEANYMNLITNQSKNMYQTLSECIGKAEKIYINVSFIRDSGIKLLINELENAKSRNCEIKILTSNYMNITEPNALYRLSSLQKIKLFKNDNNTSFHPKAYIFEYSDTEGDVFIGSSNVSYSALVDGVEWNYNLKKTENKKSFEQIVEQFRELYEKNSFDLTIEWLRKYEKEFVNNPNISFDILPSSKVLEPIKFQIPALYELSATREEGFKKAMVIVATGLGKTFLSAFDSLNFKKILFVAHREEILIQAMESFQNVHSKEKAYGFFKGDIKDKDKDLIFASVSTLGKNEYLNENYFNKDYFDYIVVDEFHHADSPTYRKIIDYFEPQFLLGLTATPERADNGDIYELCDYNIAYECNLKTGINNGWLVPFEYFGIYDEVKYDTIPWRSGKYDLNILENRLMVKERAEQIYEKYIFYKNKRTVAFCASVNHCKFMNNFFKNKNINCDLIVGEMSSKSRTEILDKFKNGKLDLLFVVDVFNEGVDIPSIDTVMFLRPTTSYTIFIQQLGRGLRTSESKTKLRVLDFVGNYKGATLKPLFLSGDYKPSETESKIISPLDMNLPSGCSVNFDLKYIDYFNSVKEKSEPLKEKLKNEYFRIKSEIERKPTILDVYTHGNYPIKIYLTEFKSWLNFLKYVGDLSDQEKNWLNNSIHDFLVMLEKTKMTKSYKMPILLSFISNDKIVKSVSIKDLEKNFKSFYDNKIHLKDLNNKNNKNLTNWSSKKLRSHILGNPINALIKSSSKIFFYDQSNETFEIKKDFFEYIDQNSDLINEIKLRITYRIKDYFKRKYEF